MSKKREPYFGNFVQQSIVEYKGLAGLKRDKLYNLTIYPALSKLVENIIHNRKLYEYGSENYTNTKLDCICYLSERLNKYDGEKGKAFSYFNRIAINFLLQNKRKIEEQKIAKVKLQIVDDERNIMNEQKISEYRDELSDFVEKWSQWGIDNIDVLFDKHRDQRIAEAIFNLFKNVNHIHNYNKKSLYIMIREQVDVKTKYITDVMGKLKTMQSEMWVEFKHSGTRKWKYWLIKED